MNLRKVEALELLGKVERLTTEGKIHEAKNEIFMAKLCPNEREKLMNTFVTSIERYNEGIKWNDICHSKIFLGDKNLDRGQDIIYNGKCRTM